MVVAGERDEVRAREWWPRAGRPSSSGTRASPRACMTSVGTRTWRASASTSSSLKPSKVRAAISGLAVRHSSSFHHWCCCRRAAGDEQIREHLAERRVVAPPADAREVDQRLGLEALLGRTRAPQRAACVRAHQHQVRDAFRMAHRIVDRHGTALRHAEQRKALQAERVDHRFEVTDPGIEREVCDVAIRQPAAALVVADVGVVARQLEQPRPPHRALEIVLDVAQPVRRADQRRSRADRGDGDARAVGGGAEAEFLARRGHEEFWRRRSLDRIGASRPDSPPDLLLLDERGLWCMRGWSNIRRLRSRAGIVDGGNGKWWTRTRSSRARSRRSTTRTSCR